MSCCSKKRPYLSGRPVFIHELVGDAAQSIRYIKMEGVAFQKIDDLALGGNKIIFYLPGRSFIAKIDKAYQLLSGILLVPGKK